VRWHDDHSQELPGVPEDPCPITDAIEQGITRLPADTASSINQVKWEIEIYAKRNQTAHWGIQVMIDIASFGNLARSIVTDLSYVNRV